VNLYIKPLGPWQKMAVKMFAAWGRSVTVKDLLWEYRLQSKIAKHALRASVLSSLVIRGYLKRMIFDDGTECYEITPLGRELARRLENAGTDTSTR